MMSGRKSTVLLILIGLLFIFYRGLARQSELQLLENKALLKGLYLNNSLALEKLTYRLGEKREKSGTSKSAQSGTFSAGPAKKVTVSKAEMSLSPKDYYGIVLSVRDIDGNFVTGDTIHLTAGKGI